MRLRVWIPGIAVATIGVASLTHAQCPDGSPPPCPRTRPIDTTAIAVFPLYVSADDTLLGEGFAELLATEFTGEGSPRRIDMATALRAWHAAGGGHRVPLTRARIVRLARDLGAGFATEGGIVRLGNQIVITTTLLKTHDGQPHGPQVRVTSSSDSLDIAVQRLGALLIASLGGQQRAIQRGVRFTESPHAMRAYLQGLADFRRGRMTEAAQLFEEAHLADSNFAQAIFRRYLAIGWGATSPALESTALPLERRAWNTRHRLSPQERILLEAVLGTTYLNPRPVDRLLADLERAAALLPDSPDALYLLGDFWYHFGGRVDAPNQLQRARDLLERAAALDSQATLLRHLVEIGLRLRDSSLIRRVVPAILRTDDATAWAAAWLGAAMVGDERLLAALRRRVRPSFTFFGSARVAHLPTPLLTEFYERQSRAFPPGELRARMKAVYAFVLVDRGRPAEANRLFQELRDTIVTVDRMLAELALVGENHSLDVRDNISRLTRRAPTDSAEATLRRCTYALWRLAHGDTASSGFENYKEDAAYQRTSPTFFCAWTIALLRSRDSDGLIPVADLARADSVLRETISPFYNGYSSYFLSRAWEASGHPERALAAIRYRVLGAAAEPIWSYREEGRLAAIVGDTAAARRAYAYYLDVTADAEPTFASIRKEVKAALARLAER